MIADGDWVESKDQDPNGHVRLTQLADVGDGEFRSRSDRWMNDEQASRLNVNYLQPGDLLMARMPDPLGRTCMVPENIGRAVTVVDVAIIRIIREDINPKFVMWLLNSPDIRQQIEMLASGTTRRRITRKNLGTIDLPMPSFEEQCKIVELLQAQLSRLDAAVADVKQAKLNAAQFRRSLLQAAFTGNLSGDGTRLMTEWKVESIGDVCSFITDGSHNPPKGISQSKYFMLSSKDIRDGHLVVDNPRFLSKNHFEIENKRTMLQLDDVLLTTVGTIGRTAIYRGVPAKVTFQRSVSILRPMRDKITPQYLRYFFDSITHVLTSKSRGVAQQGIYLNQLKKIQVSYPPLPEQQKIVEILEDHLSRLDASVAIADKMGKQSSSLRRSLLQAAFTGQLTKEVASV